MCAVCAYRRFFALPAMHGPTYEVTVAAPLRPGSGDVCEVYDLQLYEYVLCRYVVGEIRSGPVG